MIIKISGKKNRWISNNGRLIVVPVYNMMAYGEMEV
jgi:hypothetical protein